MPPGRPLPSITRPGRLHAISSFNPVIHPPEKERPVLLFAVLQANVGDALLDFRLGSGLGLRGKR